MEINWVSPDLVILVTVQRLRDRYAAAKKEPSADFEQAQALYQNMYACERLEFAVDKIPYGIQELERCLQKATANPAYDVDKERLRDFLEHGKKDLEKAREELATRKLVVAGLKDVKNDQILRILLFGEIPSLRDLGEDSWQFIMDLLWKDFISADALAALEAIVDCDLLPS